MQAGDEELVAAAAAGSADAFAALAERHRAGLVRLVALLTGDADEAESLAQEALARALAGLGEFRPGQNFRAWLRGIAVNLSRNHLRSRTRHARPVPPQELAPAADPKGRRQGVLSGILRQELHDRLWQAVGLLPPPFREAFVLHYVEGLDYDAMSEVTGVTPGSLRVRALRARGLLRQRLGPVVDTWLRQGG